MKEIEQLQDIIKDQVSTHCESSHKSFVHEIMRTASALDLPDGLLESLYLFCEEKKHLFFRGYREKVENRVKIELNRAISNGLRPVSTAPLKIEAPKPVERIQTPKDFDFNAEKNRIFLEAFLMCNQNSRRAAEFLGIPKSTFHDWKHQHQELINAELSKTGLVSHDL